MTSSEIRIPEKQAYLIPFYKRIYANNDHISKSVRSNIDKHLRTLVQVPPVNYRPKVHLGRNEIVLPLPDDIPHKDPDYLFWLSPYAERIIREQMLHNFRMVFFAHMRSFAGITTKAEAIYLFLHYWGLSFEHFDMLKKAEYRYRKLAEKKKLEKTLL